MRGISKSKELFLLGVVVIMGLFFGVLLVHRGRQERTDYIQSGGPWKIYLDFDEFRKTNRVKTKEELKLIMLYLKLVQRWDENIFRNPQTHWLGVPSSQAPEHNWLMQEVITKIKPDFIIETGTLNGGTTLFYADVLEKVNKNGKVITVDIDPQIEEASKFKTFQERVEVIKGDSVSPQVIEKIAKRVKDKTVLVTLDSDHAKKHVLKELGLYSDFVSLNSYIVVQDTIIYQHSREPNDGPMGAIKEFLKTNKNFVVDRDIEKGYFFLGYLSGFLKRVK